MLRTISSECREFPLHQIDFSALSDEELGRCVSLLVANSEETEIALRGHEIHAPRLEAADADDLPARQIIAIPERSDVNFQATMAAPGSMDEIHLAEILRTELKPDEVRVAVRAVGLNFRDIMAATGLLPRRAESEPAWLNLGLEFGGTVVAVGAEVSAFKRGDRVMGMGRGCLRAYLDQPAATLAPIADGLSLQDAATIPSAFTTAQYALNHVARLSEGEKILIHVATGGVGLAAIQLAKKIGAEIFATAGSDAKRDHLRELGIKHVMNSRSLDFADQIMAITCGRGVDVILNSLPGDFITKGIEALAPFGHFLEIGKRDVYQGSLIGMKALRKNISFSVIDLAAMGLERPELLQRLTREVLDMFAAGELHPLPATIFPISDVSEAFRYMSQARHIGKVVVDLPPEPVAVLASDDRRFTLSGDRSYLITGGSRGFGITVGDWLSQRGAGRIVFASRSGKPDAELEDCVRGDGGPRHGGGSPEARRHRHGCGARGAARFGARRQAPGGHHSRSGGHPRRLPRSARRRDGARGFASEGRRRLEPTLRADGSGHCRRFLHKLLIARAGNRLDRPGQLRGRQLFP